MEISRTGPSLESINDEAFYEICKAILQFEGYNEGPGKPQTSHDYIKQLSRTNRYMRKRTESFVFKSVLICFRSPKETTEAFESIQRCRPVRRLAKRFRLKMRDPLDPSLERVEGIPQRLVSVLALMTKLEEMSLDVPDKDVELYQEAMQQSELTLPFVRKLTLGPAMYPVVALCPNVTSVISPCGSWGNGEPLADRYSETFITTAGRAASLCHFEMNHAWTPELLRTILTSMPKISSLALMGRTNCGLEKLIPVISNFTNLHTIAIPNAFKLALGFHPSKYGCVRKGPGGDEVRRKTIKQNNKAVGKAAQLIFHTCPTVETVWIGDESKAIALRDGKRVFLEYMKEAGSRRQH